MTARKSATSAASKKATAKKTAAKRATAKKSTAKKSTAKKSRAKQAATNTTVRFWISGLCLFVPDSGGYGDADGKGSGTGRTQRHILMPDTRKHKPEHKAILVFDDVHNATSPQPKPGRSWSSVDLSDAVWSFGMGQSPKMEDLPEEILDAGRLTNTKVDKTLVRGKPPAGKVVARVVLQNGDVDGFEDGVYWEVDSAMPDGQQLTAFVYWEAREVLTSGTRLTIYKDGKPELELQAYEDEIIVELYHLPQDELPPQFGSRPPHFGHFAHALGTGNGKYPKYRGKGGRGINPVMCLVAQAELAS